MTDAQLFTLAMAVVVPLSLLLLSNSRITDTKETLRVEIATLRTELRGDISTLRNEMHTEIAGLRHETRTEILALRTEMQRGHAEVVAILDMIAAQVKTLDANVENRFRIHELEHHR